MYKPTYSKLSAMIFGLGLFCTTAYAAQIENHSFGVIRESTGRQVQPLLLYIRNQDCIASYRVAINKLILGNGELDVKKFKKTIPFGSGNIQITCGTQNTLSLQFQ